MTSCTGVRAILMKTQMKGLGEIMKKVHELLWNQVFECGGLNDAQLSIRDCIVEIADTIEKAIEVDGKAFNDVVSGVVCTTTAEFGLTADMEAAAINGLVTYWKYGDAIKAWWMSLTVYSFAMGVTGS